MLKKVLFGAAVVAAAGLGVFTANQNYNQALLSDLQLDNVEYMAEGDPSDNYENKFYDMVVKNQWKGCATGDDGYQHSATFTQWDCIDGSTLFSCRPYVEAIIYED